MNIDKKNAIIIVVGFIIAFIAIPSLAIFINNSQKDDYEHKNVTQNTAKSETLGDDVLRNLIKNNLPEESSVESININKKDVVDNEWYILTISTVESPENYANVLIRNDNKSGGYIVAGPGTGFAEDDLKGLGIPDNIIEKLNNMEIN